ncbi:MAG TPA: NosD domain-containing protein [Nocardioides sp.]|nr:NosD domain-containing protein [Nocardioides sp.]
MSNDWHQNPALIAAVGAVAGVLVTIAAAALLWPDDSAEGVVSTPSVRPSPTRTDILDPSSSEPTSDPNDEQGEDEGDDESDGSGKPEDAPPLTDAAPAGEGDLPESDAVTCPAATTTVSDADQLQAALDDAQPGDTIELQEGTYSGNFVTTASGTDAQPIFLCGSSDAVLDGGDVEGDYALHLDGAQYWRLVGFTVSGGQKGVVADGTVGSVIQGLTVSGTGDEAVHLRSFSTDNVVLDNTISDTGNRRDKYGEGVYIGSAVSNWCTYTDCRADRSDRNVVKGNTITDTSSEAIDIKEGTTGGLIVDNTFDGSAMTGADSWVDVKGNNYLIQGNTGSSAPKNGMQTHQILPGWGDLNVFRGNSLDVDTSDYAIASWPEESNVVTCDNTFVGADEGLSNIPCT